MFGSVLLDQHLLENLMNFIGGDGFLMHAPHLGIGPLRATQRQVYPSPITPSLFLAFVPVRPMAPM